MDRKTQWGPWVFNPENLTLTNKDNGYEIDLETCTTSAEMLDWIIQIDRKEWVPGSVPGLVRAFHRLIDPQRTLCSWGTERGPISVADVINDG